MKPTHNKNLTISYQQNQSATSNIPTINLQYEQANTLRVANFDLRPFADHFKQVPAPTKSSELHIKIN